MRNIARLKELNVFGAKSTNWLRDLGKVLNRRFEPNGRDRSLVRMAQARVNLAVWRPTLLWHMTRDEFLVRDFLLNWLQPRFNEGMFRIHTKDVLPYLDGIRRRGLTQHAKPWSAQTRKRVASGLLGIAADLGLLTGAAVKQFASYHLPDESFLYLLHVLAEIEANGIAIIQSPEWRMYFYTAETVERETPPTPPVSVLSITREPARSSRSLSRSEVLPSTRRAYAHERIPRLGDTPLERA